MPNLAALAFGHIRERMGSASALQGTTQSIIGGLSGTLVGLLSNGTMLPAVIVITAFAIIGRILLTFALRHTQGVTQR
jgi:DHA1 family bicyclomycin/chloramphenicol resistance-like MFS transporter